MANTREMTDLIYDCLMKNNIHEQFNINKVSEAEVDAGNNQLTFTYQDKKFLVRVEEVITT